MAHVTFETRGFCQPLAVRMKQKAVHDPYERGKRFAVTGSHMALQDLTAALASVGKIQACRVPVRMSDSSIITGNLPSQPIILWSGGCRKSRKSNEQPEILIFR